MRLPTLLGLASASLHLVACSATHDSHATGSESDLTEKRVVSQSTWVGSGASSFDREKADAALTEACNAAAGAQRAVAGARFLDAKCGESQNLAASGYLLAAEMTTRFVIDVEAAAEPTPTTTSAVHGTSSFDMADAAASLMKACDTELARARTLFGERLLGGGCDAPHNMAVSGYLQSSAFHALVMPAPGATASMESAIRAEKMSFDMNDALAAWRTACDAFGKNAAAVAGGLLVRTDCGTPKNLAMSGYLFGSTGSLGVAAGAPDTTLVTSAGAARYGNLSFDMAGSFATWRASCDASLAFAKDLLGDRFVGGGCTEPKNEATSGYLFGSRAPLLVKSAGSTKVVLDGYAIGGLSFDLAKSQEAVMKAATDALRMSIGRIGAKKVEGLAVEPSKNLATSGYLFGTKTTLLLGVNVAQGGLPPESTTSRVQGEASFDQANAAASWTKACEAAADKAKADYGDRFVGAACGEPTRTSNAYASDLTVWIML